MQTLGLQDSSNPCGTVLHCNWVRQLLWVIIKQKLWYPTKENHLLCTMKVKSQSLCGEFPQYTKSIYTKFTTALHSTSLQKGEDYCSPRNGDHPPYSPCFHLYAATLDYNSQWTRFPGGEGSWEGGRSKVIFIGCGTKEREETWARDPWGEESAPSACCLVLVHDLLSRECASHYPEFIVDYMVHFKFGVSPSIPTFWFSPKPFLLVLPSICFWLILVLSYLSCSVLCHAYFDLCVG